MKLIWKHERRDIFEKMIPVIYDNEIVAEISLNKSD